MRLTFDQALTYVGFRHPAQHIQARDKISVCCALHKEKHASFTWFLTNGGGFNCHGCGAKGSLLQFEMLFSNCTIEQARINIAKITGAALNDSGGEWVAEYIYFDRKGMPVSKKDRFKKPDGGKYFKWFRRDEAGRWQKELADDTPRLLYNAHEITTANLVIKTEGEGCAEAVKKIIPDLWPERQAKGLRIAVTTNPEGAWKPGEKPRWRSEYNKSFSDKEVVTCEDNDLPGRTLADHVSGQIYPYAESERRIAFPNEREKYDVTNWIEEHDPNTLIADFERLIESAPLWKPAAQEASTKVRPELICLADVKALPVPWLWKRYLALGMLSMLSGDPDAGKTFIALAIAASLSNGLVPVTGEKCEPVTTLYLSRENSAEYVIRPRFDALGGDPKRFHLLRGSIVGEGESAIRAGVTLSDIAILDAALARTGAKLLIVDPIQSYLGAEIDAHRSNETRPVLDGLLALAEKYVACGLIVRHLTKASSGRAIHRGLGSIDLTGAVRTEMLAGTAPEEPENRALVQIKNNLGLRAGSLGYEIVGEEMEAKLKWCGSSTLTSADLLAPDAAGEDRSDEADAEKYLREQLASGPKLLRNLKSQSGFPEWTLQRAARKIGITRSRQGERGPWIWALPEAQTAGNSMADEHRRQTPDSVAYEEDEHRRQQNAYTTTNRVVAYAEDCRLWSSDGEKSANHQPDATGFNPAAGETGEELAQPPSGTGNGSSSGVNSKAKEPLFDVEF